MDNSVALDVAAMDRTAVVLENAEPHPSRAKAKRLDELYTDYCARHAAGEAIDADEFCKQNSSLTASLAASLQNMAQLEMFLAENPDYVELDHAEPGPFPNAGDTYLGFRLVLELGKGAFSRVFLAREPKLGNRSVAVKVVQSRFAGNEPKILGQIKHPHIVPVHSVLEDKAARLTAVCMPFLGSATLNDVLDNVQLQVPSSAPSRLILEAVREASEIVGAVECPVGPARRPAAPAVLRTGTYLDGIRHIGAQLADALAYIHELGICHHDLKPTNVLMTLEGTPMLLDFNLSSDAKRLSKNVGGTPTYMAPEQLRGMIAAGKKAGAARIMNAHGALSTNDLARNAVAQATCPATGVPATQDPQADCPTVDFPTKPGPQAGRPASDGRADIFSLGVILYQLATGVHPFGPLPVKMKPHELCIMLLERQQLAVLNPCKLNPFLDRDFGQLLERCLAPDPKDRPASAVEVEAVLRAGLTPLGQARRWFVRNGRSVVAAAMFFAVIAMSAVLVYSQSQPYSQREHSAGQSLYKEGRFAQAVQHYDAAVKADPNFAQAYFDRGRAYQHMGPNDPKNYELAIDDYKQAGELDHPGRTKACIGYCHSCRGDSQTATPFYEDAINSGFATSEVYNNLGFSLLQFSEALESKAMFDKAILLNAKSQAAYHNRAVANLQIALAEIRNLNTWLKSMGPVAAQRQKDLQQEIKRLVAAGVGDVQKALDLGPRSAELEYDAACLFGLAARFDPNPKWIDAALDHLVAASEEYTPNRLPTDDDVFFVTLQTHPRFKALVVKPARNPPAPTQRLVDPVQDR